METGLNEAQADVHQTTSGVKTSDLVDGVLLFFSDSLVGELKSSISGLEPSHIGVIFVSTATGEPTPMCLVIDEYQGGVLRSLEEIINNPRIGLKLYRPLIVDDETKKRYRHTVLASFSKGIKTDLNAEVRLMMNLDCSKVDTSCTNLGFVNKIFRDSGLPDSLSVHDFSGQYEWRIAPAQTGTLDGERRVVRGMIEALGIKRSDELSDNPMARQMDFYLSSNPCLGPILRLPSAPTHEDPEQRQKRFESEKVKFDRVFGGLFHMINTDPEIHRLVGESVISKTNQRTFKSNYGKAAAEHLYDISSQLLQSMGNSDQTKLDEMVKEYNTSMESLLMSVGSTKFKSLKVVQGSSSGQFKIVLGKESASFGSTKKPTRPVFTIATEEQFKAFYKHLEKSFPGLTEEALKKVILDESPHLELASTPNGLILIDLKTMKMYHGTKFASHLLKKRVDAEKDEPLGDNEVKDKSWGSFWGSVSSGTSSAFSTASGSIGGISSTLSGLMGGLIGGSEGLFPPPFISHPGLPDASTLFSTPNIGAPSVDGMTSFASSGLGVAIGASIPGPVGDKTLQEITSKLGDASTQNVQHLCALVLTLPSMVACEARQVAADLSLGGYPSMSSDAQSMVSSLLREFAALAPTLTPSNIMNLYKSNQYQFYIAAWSGIVKWFDQCVKPYGSTLTSYVESFNTKIFSAVNKALTPQISGELISGICNMNIVKSNDGTYYTVSFDLGSSNELAYIQSLLPSVQQVPVLNSGFWNPDSKVIVNLYGLGSNANIGTLLPWLQFQNECITKVWSEYSSGDQTPFVNAANAFVYDLMVMFLQTCNCAFAEGYATSAAYINAMNSFIAKWGPWKSSTVA